MGRGSHARGRARSSWAPGVAHRAGCTGHRAAGAPLLLRRKPLGVRREDARRDGLRRRCLPSGRLHRLEAKRVPDRTAGRPRRAEARALQPPPPDPGSRGAGTAEVARVEGAADRRRRSRLAASLYLAAAGVGRLGIVDADVVDESNLQRQIVHSTERLGEPKVDSAKRTIEALNPDVEVVAYKERLTS